MKYDYLIVGAGLFGAVFAREAMDRGKTCLVLDRRDHIGGNIYTEEVEWRASRCTGTAPTSSTRRTGRCGTT